MLKSSLLEILRTFTKQELIKFEDFVSSPYFNKKENVVKLIFEIKKYAPDFKDENLEKENVWKMLFSGRKYNYGIMKNLIHDLTKLCESFITIEYTKPDILRNNTDLLAALLERQITKVFSLKYDMIEKNFDNSVFKNESYKIDNYYYFLNKLYLLKALYNRFHDPGSSSFEYISGSGDYLIYSVIISFYKHYNNYLAFIDKNIQDKDNATEMFLSCLNKNFISELLNKVKIKSERDYLILKCFHEMNFALNADADINSYFNFKKSLNDCSDIISKGDLQDLLSCLSNSLINIRESKSSTGINSNREIMEIYNLEIENNIFL